MTCPKCHGDMRTYERSGVTVDQCGECRGIFLDRGELEKLFEAEANWGQQGAGAPQPGRPGPQQGGYPPPPPPQQPGVHAPPPPPPVQGYPPQPGYGQPAYGQPAYGQPAYGYHGHYKHKKRKSFLNEMFD